MTLFWSNTIWYLLLLLVSVAVLSAAFVKTTDRRRTFAFFFAVLGFTYWLEVILLLLFKAYNYYPMITPQDSFQDAVLGNFFSQISVSSAAILIVVLDLSNLWLLVFSLIFYLIDRLFIGLGIYVHYWYRSYFTLFGFFVYGWIVKKWRRLISEGSPKAIGFLTLFFAAFAIAGNSIITTLKLAGIRRFAAGFFSESSKDHTSAALLYGVLMVILMILLVRWKKPWYVKALVIGGLLAGEYLLWRWGIMMIRPGWFPLVALADTAGYFGWVLLIDRCLASRNSAMPPAGGT